MRGERDLKRPEECVVDLLEKHAYKVSRKSYREDTTWKAKV
jgi:hypothetical protein